ncbi:HET-domain-containing protein [Corynespora cassiicola Philippines]|uniref:HET-domain-containing protein n=1 Tax=Corynespora cassiicola Philippines TaxID=1448308 RepID=A0A2T2P8Q2_CORCC|nr:HET-domain-containing protein [Corynespora cassiicola Philippines]
MLSLWLYDPSQRGDLRVRVSSVDGVEMEIEMHYPEGVAYPGDAIPVKPLTTGDTSSDISLRRVRNWIQECLSQHKCSSWDTVTPPLPTRVLDISSDLVYLALGGGRREPYACLSHQWGSEHPLRTTKSNLDCFETYIDWDDLSKVYQDAITFLRRLGIDYLWIDSLCIVSDDEQDCDREVLNMPSIYKNTFITLAATSARGGSMGMFSQTPVYIDNSSSSSSSSSVHFRHPLHHFHHYASPALFPLLDRGWVYQERLLSPRVLHFCPEELAWECRSSSHCECHAAAHLAPSSAQPKIRHEKAIRTPEAGLAAERWRAVVAEYTALKLTRRADRLVALAGVAEDFAAHQQKAYVFGLWRESLVLDLLWRCVEYPQRGGGVGRAPSWSWACRDGPIVYEPSLGSVQHQFAWPVQSAASSGGVAPCAEVIEIKGPVVELPAQLGRFPKRHDFATAFYSDVDGLQETLGREKLFGLLLVRFGDAEYSLVLRRVDRGKETFERAGLLIVYFSGDHADETSSVMEHWQQSESGIGYDAANESNVLII